MVGRRKRHIGHRSHIFTTKFKSAEVQKKVHIKTKMAENWQVHEPITIDGCSCTLFTRYHEGPGIIFDEMLKSCQTAKLSFCTFQRGWNVQGSNDRQSIIVKRRLIGKLYLFFLALVTWSLFHSLLACHGSAPNLFKNQEYMSQILFQKENIVLSS